MRLGTGLFTCQSRPDDERPAAARYDEVLTLARAADDAGLDSVWTSEHHFLDDGYLSGSMPALGAIAAATDDVEIGPCVALAPVYDGVRLAEDAATVDLLADGRLTLGLSIGSRPAEAEQFGVPADERADRLVDTVRLLRAAWSDGPLDYDAEFHPVSPDVDVTPAPAGDVPIVLGGAAKPAVRRAARLGDGWVAPSALSLDGVRKRVEDAERVRESEGVEGDFRVYAIRYGFVGDSREDAWEAMKDGYLYSQRRYEEIFSGETVDELSPERRQELKEQAVFGTPEQVAADLREYGEALGDDVHVVLRTYHPGVGTDRMRRCLERLGDEVVPEI